MRGMTRIKIGGRYETRGQENCYSNRLSIRLTALLHSTIELFNRFWGEVCYIESFHSFRIAQM